MLIAVVPKITNLGVKQGDYFFSVQNTTHSVQTQNSQADREPEKSKFSCVSADGASHRQFCMPIIQHMKLDRSKESVFNSAPNAE